MCVKIFNNVEYCTLSPPAAPGVKTICVASSKATAQHLVVVGAEPGLSNYTQSI